MVKITKILFAVSAASAGPLLAQPVQTLPVSANQDYETKVVCKSEQTTGSRFATRVCHTNQEWDQMREMHMRSASEMQKPEINILREDPRGER